MRINEYEKLNVFGYLKPWTQYLGLYNNLEMFGFTTSKVALSCVPVASRVP